MALVGDFYDEETIEQLQNELGLKLAYLRNYDKFALGISIKPTYTSLAEYSAWGFYGDIATIVPLFNNQIDHINW